MILFKQTNNNLLHKCHEKFFGQGYKVQYFSVPSVSQSLGYCEWTQEAPKFYFIESNSIYSERTTQIIKRYGGKNFICHVHLRYHISSPFTIDSPRSDFQQWKIQQLISSLLLDNTITNSKVIDVAVTPKPVDSTLLNFRFWSTSIHETHTCKQWNDMHSLFLEKTHILL